MADIKNPFELLDAGDENADPEQIAAAKKVTAAKPAAAPVAAAKVEPKGELLLHCDRKRTSIIFFAISSGR